MKEGSSFILTLVKSISNNENRLKRINVQKIVSLKDLLSKPINEVTFDLKSSKELDEISKVLSDSGNTMINIKMLSLIHILRCRRLLTYISLLSPYHINTTTLTQYRIHYQHQQN